MNYGSLFCAVNGDNEVIKKLVTLILMERETLTIRFPSDLLAKARKLKQDNESSPAAKLSKPKQEYNQPLQI